MQRIYTDKCGKDTFKVVENHGDYHFILTEYGYSEVIYTLSKDKMMDLVDKVKEYDKISTEVEMTLELEDE